MNRVEFLALSGHAIGRWARNSLNLLGQRALIFSFWKPTPMLSQLISINPGAVQKGSLWINKSLLSRSAKASGSLPATWDKDQIYVLLQISNCSKPFTEKAVLHLLNSFCFLITNQLRISFWVYLGFWILLYWSIRLPVPNSLDYHSYAVNLKTG